jgi:LuxR family maltose regulon positive regulatory protein
VADQRVATTFPIIEAKLHPPSPRPGTVERPRLVRLLSAEPRPPVVSVIAPPGYGKTTLLAQWAASARRRVAWLMLDDLDNDPAMFLSYLAVALDRIEPIDSSIRSAIAAPGGRILATAVPRLVSELDRWKRPAIIVLDDVHRLREQTCLDAVTALIDHMPKGFRIAIAGRTEPDLPFGRFRSRGDLLEIGRGLLALDELETGALAHATGVELSPDEIRSLTVRTEGWAAGVYLAAAARDGEGVTDRPLDGISGRDRYIAGYLRSEFERGLDDADVSFLRRTAILEAVEPAVAEAVTELPEAAERLRSLARENLLIAEVDGTSGSYRYHNLLRDFLLAELETHEPATLPELHRRAASWYATTGNIDLAVGHAMAGGDVDGAARLVAMAALPTFYGGHLSTLDGWLEGFTDAVFERHPSLAVIAAWINLLTGRPEATDRLADIAARATDAGDPVDGSASLESGRAMLRAVMGRDGPRGLLENARLAVSQEGPTSPWRANALWLLGSGYHLLGDDDAADAAFAEAVTVGASAGATAMVALAKRASLAMARGDWEAAARYTRQSREQLAKGHFDEIVASLAVNAVCARVAIHRGDVAAARDDLVRAQLVRPLVSYAVPWFSVDALLELARAYLAISDPGGAQLALREAEHIIRRRPAVGRLADELVEIRQRLATAASTLSGASTLTTAELRLLPMLPTYLSFEEIGDRLNISRNTVKTEAMSIYGKLQASSRGEAVERAIEIGLLEPFPGLRLAGRPSGD